MKYPKNTKLHNLPELKTFRKQLRNHLTPAEAKLWDHLKAKQLEGRKFRRQHSVGPYILDFYCSRECLAVELDGEAHASVAANDRDRERDMFLIRFGILVRRFENRLVFECLDEILDHIKQHFGWRGQHRPVVTRGGITTPALRPPLLKKEGS